MAVITCNTRPANADIVANKIAALGHEPSINTWRRLLFWESEGRFVDMTAEQVRLIFETQLSRAGWLPIPPNCWRLDLIPFDTQGPRPDVTAHFSFDRHGLTIILSTPKDGLELYIPTGVYDAEEVSF